MASPDFRLIVTMATNGPVLQPAPVTTSPSLPTPGNPGDCTHVSGLESITELLAIAFDKFLKSCFCSCIFIGYVFVERYSPESPGTPLP